MALGTVELNTDYDLLGDASSAVESWIKGQLSPDLIDSVVTAAAEKSLQSGIGTGQAARNLTIKDLGLTSLDLQQLGIQGALSITERLTALEALETQEEITAANIASNEKLGFAQLDVEREKIDLGYAELSEMTRANTMDFKIASEQIDLGYTQADIQAAGIYADLEASTYNAASLLYKTKLQVEEQWSDPLTGDSVYDDFIWMLLGA